MIRRARRSSGLAIGIGALVLALAAPVWLTAGASTAGIATFPAWSGTRTLTYCRDGGSALAMSLFAPSASPKPVPVVLQVHGGGWEGGTRFRRSAQSAVVTGLLRHGIAVASVDYRLAPRHRWPDQIQDVACALRFLRARAAALGIDGRRIGAWGPSAGGQLVSLLGTAPDDPRWNNGGYGSESDRLQAVVDEFGPVDLSDPQLPRFTAQLIEKTFDQIPGSGSAELAGASPTLRVAPGAPPFLILQGTADPVVPSNQSVTLATTLRAAGDPVSLILVRGGYHGLLNADERPGPAKVDETIVSWLVRRLGG